MDIVGERLFAKDVDASLAGGEDQLMMGVSWSCDDHRIEVVDASKQVPCALERRRNVELLGDCLSPSRVWVRQRNDIDSITRHKCRQVRTGTPEAHTNYADLETIANHGCSFHKR
jgi:hypothetical protein